MSGTINPEANEILRRHIFFATGAHERLMQLNPIFRKGEPIYVKDLKRLKCGDGFSRYAELPFLDQYDEVVAILDNVSETVQQSNQAITLAQSQISSQGSQLDSIQSQLISTSQDLNSFNSNLNSRITNLNSRIDVVEDEYPGRMNSFETSLNETENLVNSIEAEVSTRYGETNASIQELDLETNAAGVRISQIEVDINNLDSEFSRIQSELLSEIDVLIQRMDSFETQINIDPEILEGIDDLRIIIDDQKNKLENLEYSINQYFNNKRNQLNSLKSDIDYKKDTLLDLNHRVEGMEESISSGEINSVLQDIQSDINKISEDITEVVEQTESINVTINNLGVRLDNLEDSISNIENNNNPFAGFINLQDDSIDNYSASAFTNGVFMIGYDTVDSSLYLYTVNDGDWIVIESPSLILPMVSSGATSFDDGEIDVIVDNEDEG